MRRLLCLALLIFTLCAVPALAAEAPKQKTPLPDTPKPITERNTPIAVEFEGTDSLGSRLTTRVKEVFNASNLFSLTDKDTPEFPSRPGVGSAYSVVWVFSQSEATLRHYLTREVGVLTPDEVNDVAAKLIERTDALAARYGYLLQ